jgi:hypothetical protein
MIYFATRSELSQMRSLLQKFERIIAIEQTIKNQLREEGNEYLSPSGMFKDIRNEASKREPEYQELRASYAKLIPIANKICDREKVSWYRQGYAAPIEGGMAYQGSVFKFVLNRPSDIVDIDTDVRDTINQTIGSFEQKLADEFRRLVNPLYWLVQGFIFIVRLPFKILEISGFNVDIIQEHLVARFFQLLYVIALILNLIRFGLAQVIDLGSLTIP